MTDINRDDFQETLLSDVYVGTSADDEQVPCLFVFGEGIELRNDGEKKIAADIESACRYAAAEIERLREELRLCIHVDKHIHITSGLNIEIERLRRAYLSALEMRRS